MFSWVLSAHMIWFYLFCLQWLGLTLKCKLIITLFTPKLSLSLSLSLDLIPHRHRSLRLSGSLYKNRKLSRKTHPLVRSFPSIQRVKERAFDPDSLFSFRLNSSVDGHLYMLVHSCRLIALDNKKRERESKVRCDSSSPS